MSKIEELTEILVNEIDTFEKGLTRFENVNKKLDNTTVKFDLVEFKAIKQELVRELSIHKNTQERFNSRFEAQIKKAKVYPNWAVIVFITALLLSFGLMFYAYNSKQNIEVLENEAYQKGIETYENYMNSFFEQNSKSLKDFQKWKEKKIDLKNHLYN